MLFRSAFLGSQVVQLCRAAPAALHQSHLSTCAVSHQTNCQQAPGSHTTGGWWSCAAAALGLAAAAGGTAVALADSKGPISIQAASTPQPEAEGDGVSAGGKLLSLSTRQRIFFKYEKRIRCATGAEAGLPTPYRFITLLLLELRDLDHGRPPR